MHDSGNDSHDDPEATAPAQAADPRASGVFSRRRRSVWRRIGRNKPGSRQSMLPVLIKVFAGFSKVDGEITEADIDSSLGFLRYDYPETVYSELRQLYSEALAESVDLNKIAKELAGRLALAEKILLGVQLYVLISRSESPKSKLISFYLFMTNLGVASEAIDLVYQLNTGEFDNADHGSGMPPAEAAPGGETSRPLETLQFGPVKPADVVLDTISRRHRVIAFRYHDLVLIKNVGEATVVARGRQIMPGEFSRLYDGQRILIDERVISYQDLIFYFNAKKDVSSTQLFLSFAADGNARVEKSLTSDSHLEVKFGLGVTINALANTNAKIRGIPLRRGTHVEVSLEDKIVLADQREISLSDLRRRARELGGRFELLPSKFVYLVSNNPNLLSQGDILLSPGTSGEILLRITCDYKEKHGELEVLKSGGSISLGDTAVRDRAELRDGATIMLGEGQFLACYFSERIIEEQRNLISQLEVRELTYAYDAGKEKALESIGFTAKRGEMICVLGPSGCGKSTLLRTLAGHLKPSEGHVLMNGYSLFRHLDNIRPYISFIPQDEAFDPLLTVEENIDLSAAIRCPHLTRLERQKRRDGRMIELGLNERRHRLAGTATNKYLSGGERKRLNVGMDMISISDIYLFDEPTSGLSSKDSEYVMEIIRGLSQNKITIVSIHQPSARLFHMFQKALLLDRGGKLAFYGTPEEMIRYFQEAGHEADIAGSIDLLDHHEDPHTASPDVIFDVLESPLRDLGGDIIYEEDNRGHYLPARRFSPNYWRDRFQAHRLLQEVRQSQVTPELGDQSKPRMLPQPPKRGLSHELIHLGTMIRRAFLSKLRNRMNLATTLLEAPALAVLVATVLRYSEDGKYTFASAFHIPTYLFLTLVIAIFLGLTNSADDIIRDRALLNRERGHKIRISYYIAGKFLTLGLFAVLQCVVYLLIGNAILGIRDMFFTYLFWMCLTAISGVAFGLLISSLVSDSKTALNIIPLILIPQIILGGALIKYEEMNRNLDFVYSIKRWIVRDGGSDEAPSELKVPVICEFMPLRWAYESIVITQDQHNPLSASQSAIERELKSLTAKETLTEADGARLDMIKDALAHISGLDANSPGELRDQLSNIRTALDENRFHSDDFPSATNDSPVSAVDLYQNQKIRDLVTKAEMERQDYRRESSPNVFFGIRKEYFSREFSTLRINAAVLILFTVIGLTTLWFSLNRQLTRV
jgi:ABC-type multidrug transport system ATPase subunit